MTVRKRLRLPHWDAENGTYFVTFNLFDAMPAEEKANLEYERRARLRTRKDEGARNPR
ncbi:MAG: hypothetical protein ABI837_00150 [Acidobacteriota bacterium]